VLPPARGRRPLGEEHHARLVHAGGSGVAKRERQLAEYEREVGLRRLDREDVAKRLAHRDGVRDPRWHPHLVLDHPEAAVLAADHVEPGERDPASRGHATHCGLVVG
jgi:hypothetical protein